MTVTIVTEALHATLIHHTGTFVRFRKGDRAFLPTAERACEIELPDSRVVEGKFSGNRDLFNVNGPLLTRWIKSLLPYTESTSVVVHPVGRTDRVRLELPVGRTAITPGARRTLLAKAPRTSGMTTERKRQAFTRWERDPRLGRFVKDVWGTRCQVLHCATQDHVGSSADVERLVDVHHLQSVSAGGDDSPANLVVLCMMHHGLMHRAAGVPKVMVRANAVEIAIGSINIDIERDLKELNRAISWHP